MIVRLDGDRANVKDKMERIKLQYLHLYISNPGTMYRYDIAMSSISSPRLDFKSLIQGRSTNPSQRGRPASHLQSKANSSQPS